MNPKERYYSGVARETIHRITANRENWTSFLATMARNYDFTYPEQVMIYAQRPNATLCKPYEEWNTDQYRRYVKRGSTGIALFVMNQDKPYLRYVFDVADTGVRRSSPSITPWRVTDENRRFIMDEMERVFQVPSEGILEYQLENIAINLAREYWDDFKKPILDIVADSFLEEYDEYNIEVAFKTAVANSVSYAMYSRITENPDNYFEHTYTDENGNKRQKWETFETNAEAKKRKLQVEYEQESGTFIPPSAKTVNDLLDEYMSIYGVNTWAMSTYESRKSLIANYIRPLIGDMKLEDVTPRIMDKYYRDLLSVKAVSSKYVKARTEYLTPHTVREVHKTLRNAFNQAVKWELMTRNPVEHATLPKEEHKTRDIWTAEVLQKALEACDDDILRLAINLAFSCSLRMGELLGLTWDCIDISPTSIELGQASIFVEKELQRVNREAMADLDGKDIMFKFPPTFASTHTALVLKTPKTKTSVRKVFLPKTVAEMLVQRKADIEELKDLFGDEFVDFNLVFCSSNGKPIEGQVINRAFNKLIEEKGLPKVVFHSLRHSSITYKLKLNGGDMKSVQGDSGHAQVKMVADVYSHIIDDDRRLNAERMEAAFYSGRQATPEPVQPAATESSADDKELLLKLLQNPEMAALLKSLAKTL